MKINGALKPRQGASRQGSSPGVVQRKYRVKRYSKVNENVVNRLPRNECGHDVNNNEKYLNENLNNSNYICIKIQKQQHRQQPAPQTQQQRQQQQNQNQTRECGELFSISSNCGLSTSRKISTSMKSNKKLIKSAKPAPNTNTNIGLDWIVLNRSENSEKIQEKTTFTAAVSATETQTSALEKDNNAKKINIKINLKQIGKVKIENTNITTRQIGNTQNNKENNRSNEKVEEYKLDTFEYHATCESGSDIICDNLDKINNNNINNKVLLKQQIYEYINLTVLISRLFIHLKLLLFFMLTHATKHLSGNSFVRCAGVQGIGGRASKTGCHSSKMVGYNLAKIMRASQSLDGSIERICFRNANKTRVPPSIALCLMVFAAAAVFLPQSVVADDGDNFFPVNGLETTTPEFDYASRGQKKFGDKCENTLECGFPGSICDPKKKSCQCTEDLPVTNHIDKCGKEAAVNESCFFNEQCEVKYFQTECRDQRCVCRFDMTPIWLKDGSVECKGRGDKKGPETYIDPAMIGVLIGMALMFIIICVVLRLFSQARWRENRTIFNTPNPRLMNVSLLRESKLLHGQERRGSRMSVRAPSRQPSMASLRPHSPNPSLGKTGSRSNSHGSNASATSLRSTRSNSVSPAGIVVNNSHHERKGSTYQPHHQQHQHHQHPTSQQKHQQHQQQQQQQQQQQEQQPLTQTNIISNPVAETVTVEIIEPEK